MTYSGDVRIIRIPSASRITDKLIIYTFQQGADGILIGDCPEKSSRFAWSKQQTLENIKAAQSYLKTIGIENKRIVFAEFASGMLADFVNGVNQLADVIKTSETVQVNSNR